MHRHHHHQQQPSSTTTTHSLVVLSEIRNKITGIQGLTLIQPHRSFLQECDVDVTESSSSSTTTAPARAQSRHIFLFNDVLVITKTKQKHISYEYIDHIETKNMLVQSLQHKNMSVGQGFELVRVQAGRNTKYVLVLGKKREAEAQALFDALTKLISTALEKSNISKLFGRGGGGMEGNSGGGGGAFSNNFLSSSPVPMQSSSSSSSTLFDAAYSGNLDQLRLFVQCKEDLNKQDENGLIIISLKSFIR
eukprot:TRINITY_DN8052_c0_g1_i1.p1 TRINITY_DN8052_c0_g1~~TRINITY_DN8052_c0_g1_i1.p1  ORF type:complete len:249 (+),score=42.74 TRINITY_DN8052_c0_g1_i1:57-803(+)